MALYEKLRQAPMWLRRFFFPAGLGWALLVVGFFMPSLIGESHFGVLDSIYHAVDTEDSGRLLLAALRLVTMNTLRAMPIYLGAFLIGEPFLDSAYYDKKRLWGYILPVAAIPLIYRGILVAHGIEYDLGVPALLATLSLVILHQISFRTHSRRIRAVLLLLLLYAVQWLDVAPVLTDIGFGRGELSRTIKQAAEFLQTADVLNVWSLSLAAFLTFIALITAKFMVDASKHLALLEQTRRQEAAMQRARLEQIEARTNREIQSLVHDLKTPLTTIEGLASLIKMIAKDGGVKKHVSVIEGAAERMSSMISEMLHSGPTQVLTLGELFEFVRAQMPGQRDYVKFYVEDGTVPVRINRIRLARALVNIIRNGIESGSTQPVAVKAKGSPTGVRITIADCGRGIPKKNLKSIWQAGYSTKGGSGLGLPFARTVIEKDHNGRISVESVLNRGTTFHIELPGLEGEGGNKADDDPAETASAVH